jgi:hypothetical protein
MRNCIFRLAILAAVSLVVPITILSAQGMTLPRPLAAALSARLHAEEQIQAQSSKPWITAQRAPAIRVLASPEEAAP